MPDANRAVKEPKPTKADWYDRIEKAKQAREQGRLAQAAQNEQLPPPKWHE